MSQYEGTLIVVTDISGAPRLGGRGVLCISASPTRAERHAQGSGVGQKWRMSAYHDAEYCKTAELYKPRQTYEQMETVISTRSQSLVYHLYTHRHHTFNTICR